MTEVLQQNPHDNSVEAIKENLKKMIDIAPIGTYWKQVWHDPSKNDTRIIDYYQVKSLEKSIDGKGVLKGERIQVDESCLYDLDDRASLYDFSFDKNHGAYYAEQISKEDYMTIKNRLIKIYENKSNESIRRRALFYGFYENNQKFDYSSIIEIVRKRYDYLGDEINRIKELLEEFKNNKDHEKVLEIEKYMDKLREENTLFVFSQRKKDDHINKLDSFDIHEIDVTSLNFNPKTIDSNGKGYVDGTPFESNGKNITFNVRVYSQNLHVENYSRDYFGSNIRIYFDNGNKNWRWENPDGWRTYISKNDEYSSGKYVNSPCWSGNDFYILDRWHFEQLLDLINYTGL